MGEQKTVKLGIPLDFLFDRECKLSDWEKGNELPGGLRIPDDDNPANCSIVLRGRPGTGKSVLAMQMAVKCCRYNNGCFAVYLSLEESWRQVSGKARSFAWEDDLVPLASLTGLDAHASPAECGRALRRILTRPGNCPQVTSCLPSTAAEAGPDNCDHDHSSGNETRGRVLVGNLSPRNLTPSRSGSDEVFATRYRQLEHLLRGAAWLRRPQAEEDVRLPRLTMVCIDSLNVFGDRLLTREQIHQLFDLFQQQRTIGVFVVEEDEGQLFSSDARLHADTIEYLSDAVVSLRADEDSDYFVRYFEIVKSRYQHQVYGKHPFRIVAKQSKTKPDSKDDAGQGTMEGVVIYPSLHYFVYGTDMRKSHAGSESKSHGEKDQSAGKNAFPLGDENLSFLLPPDCLDGDVVLIAGPRATFKHTLAINFLVSGLTVGSDGTPDSSLLIRLHDRPGFRPSQDLRLGQGVRRPQLDPVVGATGIPAHPTKYDATVYQCRDQGPEGPRLIEMAFKSGNILPEEFLHHIRHVIRHAGTSKHPIRRIALTEVGLIGVSYPFLKRSRTAGDLFLTALVHTLRNYGSISLLMTGTTDQYEEADEMIDRARTLADAVLTCSRCDVFGNRLVVAEGERLMAGFSEEPTKGGIRREYGEYVPAVIVPCGTDQFYIDLRRLEGLVGFGAGEIVRPGLICRVLEEGQIQREYNDSITRILPHTFAGRSDGGGPRKLGNRGVRVEPYASADSAVVFDSLELSRNWPLQQTVVASIDEFCLARDDPADPTRNLASSAFIKLSNRIPDYEAQADHFMDTIWTENISHAHPYYANVMLLAYRVRDDNDEPICIKWHGDTLNLTAKDSESIAKLPWSEKERERYMWRRLRNFVERIHAELEGGAGEKPGGDSSIRNEPGPFRLFDWVDVPETWACILLDAITNSAYQKFMSDKKQKSMVMNLLNTPEKIHGLSSEASRQKIRYIDQERGKMLSGLLRSQYDFDLEDVRRPLIHSLLAAQHLINADTGLRDGSERRKNRLDPRAAAYVCWYSQLRNLIQRHPKLANKLDVAPLPGGGFRGDWFLGVAQGSVSIALGVELIKTLCLEHEERRRFSLGVGMPVRRKFYEKGDHFGWLGGEHVKLQKLQQIHRDALTRESIPGYRRFRNVLQTVCHQVVGKPGEVIPYKTERQLWETLRRIPEQINMLLPDR